MNKTDGFFADLRDSKDAPYPGMIAAFENHFGVSFAEPSFRSEASVWAAAWKAAKANTEALQAQVAALTEQIDAAKNQAPVAWSVSDMYLYWRLDDAKAHINNPRNITPEPLYAAPVPPVLRDLSDEELFDAALNFDCGTHGENTEWRLNSPVELRELHDAIIKAAREKQ